MARAQCLGELRPRVAKVVDAHQLGRAPARRDGRKEAKRRLERVAGARLHRRLEAKAMLERKRRDVEHTVYHAAESQRMAGSVPEAEDFRDGTRRNHRDVATLPRPRR